MLLLTLPLFLFSILLSTEGQSPGWLGTLFIGICLAVFSMQLIPGSTYLRLTPQGFTFCTLWRKRFFPWSTVENFRPGRIGINHPAGELAINAVSLFVPGAGQRGPKTVVFDFAPGPESVKNEKARRLCGYDMALPDNYGMKAQKLAELLNKWKAGHEAASVS